MARLILKSITCITAAEVGSDELYVTFNGTKRSLPDMREGKTQALNQQFSFTGPSSLSLFEDDGNHWYDRDDFIASQTITESQAPDDFPLEFHATSGNAKGARYELVVNVTPV